MGLVEWCFYKRTWRGTHQGAHTETTGGHRKKVAVLTLGREASEETTPANTLIVSIQPPKLRKQTCLVHAPPPQGYVVRAPSADEHRRYRRNPANWCVVAATLMFVFLSCMNRRKLFKITCQSHHVLVRNKLCRGGFSKSCWQIEGFLKKYSKRSNDGSLEMSGDSSIDPVFGPEKRAGSFQS